MRFESCAITDIGRKRSQNQDSVTIHPEIGLFVVADGMGGHRGGEVASGLAVKTIPELVLQGAQAPEWSPRSVLTEAIRQANRIVYSASSEQPKLSGMGTTVTALLFKDNKLTVGHVGDSRCYFFRPGAIWQATRDHSFVEEKVRAGLITRDEARTDRQRNVITRSVGISPDVNVEIYEMNVKVGDVFVICSDGLSGMIQEPKMLEIVQSQLFDAPSRDHKKTVETLIEAANSAGGDDNITAVLVEVAELDEITDHGIQETIHGNA
jgi:PPM family protein phosphatase